MTTFKVSVSRIPLEHKIPPGDPIWPRFNASFDNKEITVEELLNVIYGGQSITTWHKDNWRTSENYLLGQHIGLDFDAGDKTSTLDALVHDKFIGRYGAFVYTTMSHTPEAPRGRAIFLLDTPIIQAKNYTLAVSALLWLFGTADRQCKDAVRFFYGSPDCEFEFMGQVLPLDVIKRLITSYLESGAAERKHAERSNYAAPANQQEVDEALKVIPAWGVSYDEWVEILMGIHSQFGEGGFAMAQAWADAKPGELEQKWKSFKAAGNGQGGITIATVFGIAKKFGWRKR